MADASRDENRVATLLAVDSADGETPLKAEITETTGRLRVDALLTGDDATTVDVDDDNIAKAQVLPLKITENYVFSKGDDAWIRMQGNGDGYQFVSVIGTYGIYTPGGDPMYNDTDDTLKTAPYGVYDRYTQDASTESLINIDHIHHEVHEGNFYRSGFSYVLGNGEVATLAFTTPDSTTWAHMTWSLTTTADGTFTVLEDLESYSGGASVTPLNQNRNSGNTSDMTLERGMTGDNLITPTGGTTILNAVLPTARGSTVARDTGEEFILKQNSIYLFRYTNGTTENGVRFVMTWYEHADLN
jgi:hypothetical protein